MHRRFAQIQRDAGRSLKLKTGKSCFCNTALYVLYQIYAFASCLKSDQLQKLLLEVNLQDGISKVEINLFFCHKRAPHRAKNQSNSC